MQTVHIANLCTWLAHTLCKGLIWNYKNCWAQLWLLFGILSAQTFWNGFSFKKITVCLSVCPSVCLSVRPSVSLSVCTCHTFFTMFPSWYHHEIFRSDYQWQKWCLCKSTKSEVKSQCYRDNKANLRDLIAATGLVISNWIQIVDFSACVTLKFDGWPQNTIGHFFYTTSSFVPGASFQTLCEFKLELQSGNAQFGSKLAMFCPVWPWNLMDDLGKQ